MCLLYFVKMPPEWVGSWPWALGEGKFRGPTFKGRGDLAFWKEGSRNEHSTGVSDLCLQELDRASSYLILGLLIP